MSSKRTEIEQRDDKVSVKPTPLVPDTWQTTAALGLFLNLLGGLIVAAILLFATTPSRVLIVTAIFFVIVSAIGTMILFKKSRRLENENRSLRSSLTGCEVRYDQKLKSIGITDITDAMEGSEWSPDAVMERAQNQVKFLGVFGHKWVMDSDRQNRFRSMLTRIQLNGGKVQFLLLNPNGASASKLALYRNQATDFYKDFRSIEFYKILAKEFDCFELRLFEQFPFIRMISVDGVCSISRFKTQKSAEHTLKAPQLVFAPEGPNDNWTMYQALVLLYEFLWGLARDPFSIPGATSSLNVPIDSDTKEVIAQ
jgi:hypothetical protein